VSIRPVSLSMPDCLRQNLCMSRIDRDMAWLRFVHVLHRSCGCVRRKHACASFPATAYQNALVRAEKRAITCNNDILHYLRKLPESSELTLNDFSLDSISLNNPDTARLPASSAGYRSCSVPALVSRDTLVPALGSFCSMHFCRPTAWISGHLAPTTDMFRALSFDQPSRVSFERQSLMTPRMPPCSRPIWAFRATCRSYSPFRAMLASS
jgi:hypothetical protein